MDSPVKRVNAQASTLKEEDVDWIVSEMMDHFSGKIHSLATYVYGSEQGVALAAFKEYASQTLENGTKTFLFKSEHWRTGRSIGPYLSACLGKLADSLKSDIDFVKKVSIPICPACKTLSSREYLTYEGKLLRCPTCTKESIRLADKERSSREEYEYRLRKVFSLHSRKGYRCPDCERFVPHSTIDGAERTSCPYDDCGWFGKATDLKLMSHPVGQSSGVTVSLNATVGEGSEAMSQKFQEFGDMLDANEVTPDIRIEQAEKYLRELEVTRAVLSTQRERLSRQPSPKTIKKYLMYKAFESLLEHDPEGMIAYLIHGKSRGERPIQSLIFQRYIQLVENHLPFDVYGEDGILEAYSLLDPNLDLFLGVSEYQTHVRESGFVANNTHEIFQGSKCNGPCFIGMLCDITDGDDNSLMSEVEYYTFSSIKMKDTVQPNTLVKVTHFRIPPHYEMYSLVNLQRVRRKVVDSIYKRLHGEKRPLKSNESSKVISQVSDR